MQTFSGICRAKPETIGFQEWVKELIRCGLKIESERAKLVEALRNCIRGMPHNPAQDEAIDLLRELGEL